MTRDHPAQLDADHDAVFAPLTVRVREACRLTGLSRSKLYELIKAGEIEIAKAGSATLVIVASLQAFLERQRQKP